MTIWRERDVEDFISTTSSLQRLRSPQSVRVRVFCRCSKSLVLRLTALNVSFACEWLAINLDHSKRWRSYWAVTEQERLRLRCIADALVAELYGIDVHDFAWIVRDCDLPCSQLASSEGGFQLDPKGFWRVDQEKDPELRHTVLSLVAFQELKQIGLEEFLSLNDGEGWMLPETLRLADVGLGRDSRAQHPQPVASRLGPRFLASQLDGTAEETWRECARHAETLKTLNPVGTALSAGGASAVASGPHDLFGNSLETDLFGNPRVPNGRGRA